MASFQCSICLKSFKTKQQLQRHENRRFKCKPTDDDTETHGFICKCGKSYRYDSGLYRHRATCPAVLQAQTVKALADGVTLNTVDKLSISNISRQHVKKECDNAGTASEFFKVQYMKECRSWTRYKDLYKYIIDNLFFNTPSNMLFYIPNFSEKNALMYDGETLHTITQKEMIDHIKDLIDDVIDIIIEKMDLPTHHPFVFIRHFKNIYNPPKTSNDSYKRIYDDIEAHIHHQYREHKQDIHVVWSKSGIIKNGINLINA